MEKKEYKKKEEKKEAQVVDEDNLSNENFCEDQLPLPSSQNWARKSKLKYKLLWLK